MLLEMSDGRIIDTASGKVEGKREGTPTSTSMLEPRPDQPSEDNPLMSAAKQFSWEFNSLLFALPDKAVAAVGQAMGANEKDIPSLTKFFNRGEVAPHNAADRYARALSHVAVTLPFTGAGLFAASRMAPITLVNTSKTGIIRGVANDLVKLYQKSPGAMIATDLAFSAGFEGLKQAVRENVDSDNPNKQLYEELLPMAAFMGLPAAVHLLPSVRIANAVKDKAMGYLDTQTAISEESKKVYDQLSKGWKLPVINIAPKMLLKRAESKVAKYFSDINTPEAQEGIRRLEWALENPKFDGFQFGYAQKTMDPMVLREQAKVLEALPPALREEYLRNENNNIQKFEALAAGLAPEAQQSLMEALKASLAEREGLSRTILNNITNLTEAETASVLARLGPQNMDMVNKEIRGALMAAMEFDHSMRDRTLRLMGLRQATSPEGLPLATREEGQSLFPSKDMEDAAIALIKKYTPERPSLRTPVPEPIKLLSDFIQSQQMARERLENQTIKDLTNARVSEQLASFNHTLPPDLEKAVRNTAISSVQGGKQVKGTRRVPSLGEATGQAKEGEKINIRTGIGKNFITINPSQIKADAALAVADKTAVDINLPEALDYLAAAARYRNDSLVKYNEAMSSRTPRLTDAQRILDKGKAVYTDIEKLILDHVPKIKQEYSGMKSVLEDYKTGFEQNLPLLISRKRKGGEEFLLDNEEIMREAFSSAENLRQLQVTLAGAPQFEDLLTRGMVDWLRTKGAVNNEGLVDPKKIRSILDKNRNIVEALPAELQTKLTNEVALADAYVARLGELDRRKIAVGDDELRNVLQKATRPDADPREVVAAALKDPALMRSLVDRLSKPIFTGAEPEGLSALRRAVYDLATEGMQKGGALEAFITNNKPALKVLYKNQPEHLANIEKLAEIQRRVYAFSDVTGRMPKFESLEDVARRTMGSGIGVMSTTFRSVKEGRLSPETGAIAFMVRMMSSLEKNLYNRIFQRAMESEKFANSLVNKVKTGDNPELSKMLQSIGIQRSGLTKRADRTARQMLGDVVTEDNQVPVRGAAEAPVVPRGTALQMLRELPPAPPTTGLNMPEEPKRRQIPVGPPAILPSMTNVPLRYSQLFPNDPISGMLEQRMKQQMLQMPQMPPR